MITFGRYDRPVHTLQEQHICRFYMKIYIIIHIIMQIGNNY